MQYKSCLAFCLVCAIVATTEPRAADMGEIDTTIIVKSELLFPKPDRGLNQLVGADGDLNLAGKLGFRVQQHGIEVFVDTEAGYEDQVAGLLAELGAKNLVVVEGLVGVRFPMGILRPSTNPRGSLVFGNPTT